MHMKLFLYIFVVVTVSAMTSVVAQEADTIRGVVAIDRIVAVVNEEVITQRELDDAIEAGINQLLQQGVQPPDRDVLADQILESVVVKRIQLQRAKEVGLSINESELDETIHRIAEENKLSVQEFYDVLERDKIDFSRFRQEVRDEMIMVRLKEREINKQINITEREVDNFIRTQETSAIDNEEYRIAHILIRIPERMDPAQIEKRRERAEMALGRLKEGAEFAQVTAEFSDAADAMQGGILDWRPIAQMGPKFAELLAPLQPDELTPIIQSPAGFHIFKLLERRAQEVPVVIIDQTHARHILIKVSELTAKSDAMEQIIQLKKRIDNGASFSEIAKLHSEDASASSGGDLGWISPGDTVPAFEQAMNALLPGQISEPVESPFGWHLIQVIERRTQDVSTERQRQTAHQAIRARKADVVIQDWLQQLRDQAYVEYRIEDH